jgi:hypothetical protein
MPEPGCTHDRGHKYPFTVSEIFNCELSALNELFFTSRLEVAKLNPRQVSPLPPKAEDE